LPFDSEQLGHRRSQKGRYVVYTLPKDVKIRFSFSGENDTIVFLKKNTEITVMNITPVDTTEMKEKAKQQDTVPQDILGISNFVPHRSLVVLSGANRT